MQSYVGDAGFLFFSIFQLDIGGIQYNTARPRPLYELPNARGFVCMCACICFGMMVIA